MSRQPPPRRIKAAIRHEQRNRCAYCGIPVDAVVLRKLIEVQLTEQWDHFVPFAYSAANPGDGWVLACHVCNGIKSDKVFGSLRVAQFEIRRTREDKGYETTGDYWLRQDDLEAEARMVDDLTEQDQVRAYMAGRAEVKIPNRGHMICMSGRCHERAVFLMGHQYPSCQDHRASVLDYARAWSDGGRVTARRL